MNAAVGELLILALVVAAAGLMASAIAVPEPPVVYKIKVNDAYPPVSSGELFDVVMVSGSMPYSELRISLINSTTGRIVGVAYYSNGNMTGGIFALIDDNDGSFNSGDFLRFADAGSNITQGIYRVTITDGKHLAFDGRVSIT